MTAPDPARALAPQELVTETARLRALARALVGDSHRAEDVVQDAWVAALERRAGAGGLPAWLSAVAARLSRRALRGERRRRRREAAAARGEAVRSAAETVERLALVGELARAVTALEEPYRGAVVLRFVEGLPPR